MSLVSTLMVALSLVLATTGALAAPPSSSATDTPKLNWQPLAGWTAERIAFPPDFAPSFPYRGYAELRYPPDFKNPSSPFYFTCAFVWVVHRSRLTPGPRATWLNTLAGDLRHYFDRLMGSAAASKGRALGKDFTSNARLDFLMSNQEDLQAVGELSTIDALITNKPLSLQLRLFRRHRALGASSADWRLHYFEVGRDLTRPDVLQALTRVRMSLAPPPQVKSDRPNVMDK